MTIEVQMPKMGESITEGRVLKWHKQPGDAVDRDETILDIATDKVDTEVPSPASGIITQLLAAEGDTVEVGAVVAYIETDAAAAADAVAAAPAAAASATATAAAPVPAAVASDGSIVEYSAPAGTAGEGAAEHVPAGVASDEDLEGRFFSPVVLRIASERGVSMQQLASINGTGSRGRVTKADLLAWLEQGGASAAPAAAAAQAASPAMPAAAAQAAAPMAAPVPVAAGQGVEVIPMDNMRRLMAEHMVRSKQISPHVALVSEADLTRVVAFRDRHAEAFKAREGFSLTFMPFIADATVRALKEFPLLNASIDGTNILVKRFVNLGVAVALEHGGLIVPVVRGADALNAVGLARGIYDVASRARSRKLQPEEIQDGTFTITNFGVFGNVMGIPIINQPQVAILGVGALVKKPVVIERDGEDVIAIRRMVQLSLSFDHRLVDGALGGQFLQRVVQHLENFDLQSI